MVREMTNNDPVHMKTAMKALQHLARDHARLPMQWSPAANAGFSHPSAKKPWMRPHDNHKEVNVQVQQDDPSSVLSFWKQMIQLRKTYANFFVFGIFELLDEGNQKIFSYLKTWKEQCMLVVLNFSEEPQPFQKPMELQNRDLKLFVSNIGKPVSGECELQPYEGRIFEVKAIPN